MITPARKRQRDALVTVQRPYGSTKGQSAEEIAYAVSPAELDEYAAQWGVSPDLARVWVARCSLNSMYTTMVEFKTVLLGRLVTLLCVSTGASTRRSAENRHMLAQGMDVEYPYWLDYAVYLYDGARNLGNMSAQLMLHDDEYLLEEGTRTVAQVLDQKFGNTAWRQACRVTAYGQGEFDMVMRKFLVGIGCDVWYERVCGLSWKAYKGLDMYEVLITPNMVLQHGMPVEGNWYILNAEGPPMTRDEYGADQWYHCHYWYHVGQRELPNIWLRQEVGIELPAEVSKHMDLVVQRHLRIPLAPLLSHLFGDRRGPSIQFLRAPGADQALCRIVMAMQKAGRGASKDEVVFLYSQFVNSIRAITGGDPDGMSRL